MRKTVFATISVILMFVLTACVQQNSDTGAIEEPKELQRQGLVYKAVNTDNSITENDGDLAYSMCLDFLNAYYSSDFEMDKDRLSNFMLNSSLIKYSELKIKVSDFASKSAITHANNYKIKLEAFEDKGYVFLEIGNEVLHDYGGGFSEAHQFLVVNKNGFLSIADWYCLGKDHSAQVDDICREYKRQIDDADIWDDIAWANEVFEKAKVFDK